MPGLNGMRAIAVTAVVWHHSHPGIAELALTRRGFLGVDIFFVLSGFLITTLLLRERAEFGAISLRQFYVRRTLRIFPLYYAVLLALAAYFTFARQASEREAFFAGLPFYLTYTSNWFDASGMMSITWSLSAEEQFYLLWPPLLRPQQVSSGRPLHSLGVESSRLPWSAVDHIHLRPNGTRL